MMSSFNDAPPLSSLYLCTACQLQQYHVFTYFNSHLIFCAFNKSSALAQRAFLSTLLSISLSSSLLPWIGFDNLLLPLKARSPLENSVTCLSGRISMEDLQTQRSSSMDWLSKFTEVYIRRPLVSFHLATKKRRPESSNLVSN